jgi:long-chain fatty acid transport protein
MKNTPHSTLGELDGLGNLPLGPGSPVPAFSTDLIGLVQTSLLPVVWEHNVSAGVGYSFGAANVNLFVSYAFEEELDYEATTVGALVGVVVPGLGSPVYTGKPSEEIIVGIGLTIKVGN